MIIRIPVICPVCKKITLVRVQVGFLDRHPIRFNCGNCKITIKGEYKNGEAKFSYCEISDDHENVDYVIQSSGELLCHSLKKVKTVEDTLLYSPFINTSVLIKKENQKNFRDKLNLCLKYILKIAPLTTRIHELYLNNQINYLDSELEKFQFPPAFKDKTLDRMQKIHLLDLRLLDALNHDTYDKSCKRIFDFTNFLNKEPDQRLKINELKKMCDYFSEDNRLKKWQKKLYYAIQNFINNFERFLPIVGLEYYDLSIEQLNTDYAITTVSLEEIQSMYIQFYELLGDLLPLIVAFDNIFYRKDFQKLKNNEIKVKSKYISTLQDYEKIAQKGTRFQYFDDTEIFGKIITNSINNKIRNSLGHFDYDLSIEDLFTQRITFHDRSTNITISLIEFCFNVLNIFISLLEVDELLYQANKLNYVFTISINDSQSL